MSYLILFLFKLFIFCLIICFSSGMQIFFCFGVFLLILLLAFTDIFQLFQFVLLFRHLYFDLEISLLTFLIIHCAFSIQLEWGYLNSRLGVSHSFHFISESLKVYTFRLLDQLLFVWLLNFKFVKFSHKTLRIKLIFKGKWRLYFSAQNILKINRSKKLVSFYLLSVPLKP